MAATLLPIVDLGGSAAAVVTKRAGDLDHGGDWVFPGGRVDYADASHQEAARREAAEELGIDVGHIDVVGQLWTRGPIITGYVIETYVGVLDPAVTFAPDPREVAEVALIKLTDLLAADRHHRGPAAVERHSDIADRLDFSPDLRNLRHYRVRADENLWGLQADLLHELLTHVTAGAHDF